MQCIFTACAYAMCWKRVGIRTTRVCAVSIAMAIDANNLIGAHSVRRCASTRATHADSVSPCAASHAFLLFPLANLFADASSLVAANATAAAASFALYRNEHTSPRVVGSRR